MAIALDTSAGGSSVGGTSISYSHTCTGSNLILIIIIRTQNAAIPPNSVTYNGSSSGITLIDNITAVGYNLSTYYLINPTAGAHTLAATTGSATNWTVCSASYTGANQFIQPDAHNAAASSSVGVTVVNTGCWVVGGAGGTSLTAGSGFTQRQDQSPGGNEGSLIDTNGTVSTGVTTVSSGGTVGVIAGASIVPAPTTLYWVGGTGNWDTSTATHWAITSGGSGGYGVPSSGVAVIFDGNSGGGTTTVSAITSCASLTCTGYTGTITQSSALTIVGAYVGAASGTLSIGAAFSTGTTATFNGTTSIGATTTIGTDCTFTASKTVSGSSAINIGGSLTLGATLTNTYTGTITFTSTASGKTITTNSNSLASAITFNGVGGGWTFQDALTTTGIVTLTNGSVNLNNLSHTVGAFSSTNSNTRVLTLGSGTLTLTSTGTVWNLATSTGMTLTANTSTIKLTNATSSSKTFSGGGLTYNNLYITGSGSGTYTIVGNNTFSDFKVDTPPHTVNFTAGSIQTLNTFTVNGTAGNLMTLQSTNTGQQWFLVKSPTGTVSCDYLSLQDSHVS